MKSFGGATVLKEKRQPLTGPFKGTEHLGAYVGHGGKSIGAVCDPAAFTEVSRLLRVCWDRSTAKLWWISWSLVANRRPGPAKWFMKQSSRTLRPGS